MRKLPTLMVLCALLVGVSPTVLAQAETSPHPAMPHTLLSCPDPLATAEKSAQTMVSFELTDSGIVLYGVRTILEEWDLYAVSVQDGTPAHRLCSHCGFEMWVDEDAQAFAFTNAYDKRLYRVPLSGGGASRLIYYPAGDLLTQGILTPDHQYYISVVNSISKGRMMYRTDATGGNVTVLIDSMPPMYSAIQVTSDNTLIYLASALAQPESRHLYAQPIDGSERIVLTPDWPIDAAFKVSGDSVYFTVHDPHRQTTTFYEAALDGSSLTTMAEIQNPIDLAYEISPDGQALVYRNGVRLYAISLHAPDGAVPIKLMDLYDGQHAKWVFTPDNQAILVLQWGSIYRLPLSGGESPVINSQLILGIATPLNPQFVGDWIIHRSQEEGVAIPDYLLIPADGVGSTVQFARSELFIADDPNYVIEGSHFIFVKSDAGTSAIYTTPLADLGQLGQGAPIIECTTVQGSIQLIGVYANQVVYAVVGGATDSIYAVPLLPQ